MIDLLTISVSPSIMQSNQLACMVLPDAVAARVIYFLEGKCLYLKLERVTVSLD